MGRLAMTIQTAMFRTSAARLFYLMAKSLPRSMHANRRILGCNTGLARQFVQIPFLQIYNPQRVSVFRLQCCEQAGDALADFLLQLRLGPLACGKVLPPSFMCPRSGRTVPIVINHRVTQDSIEPCHNSFIIHTRRPFQATCEGGLQDVFSGFFGLHAPLQEC
jgi:hypothetical protein